MAIELGATYEVFKGDKKVEEITNAPGPIVSRAAPPPDGKLARHPWITAVSHDINEESALFDIFDEAQDFADYVTRLRKAGYRVEPLKD